MDPFGRKIDYLRISVTDRCNERCLYCMPEGYKGWESKPDHLTAEEIIRVVRVAAGLGFRKFRLTGGEPLVRGDVPEIVRAMTKIPGVEIRRAFNQRNKTGRAGATAARCRLAHGEREPRRARPANLPPRHRRRRGESHCRNPRRRRGGLRAGKTELRPHARRERARTLAAGVVCRRTRPAAAAHRIDAADDDGGVDGEKFPARVARRCNCWRGRTN